MDWCGRDRRNSPSQARYLATPDKVYGKHALANQMDREPDYAVVVPKRPIPELAPGEWVLEKFLSPQEACCRTSIPATAETFAMSSIGTPIARSKNQMGTHRIQVEAQADSVDGALFSRTRPTNLELRKQGQSQIGFEISYPAEVRKTNVIKTQINVDAKAGTSAVTRNKRRKTKDVYGQVTVNTAIPKSLPLFGLLDYDTTRDFGQPIYMRMKKQGIVENFEPSRSKNIEVARAKMGAAPTIVARFPVKVDTKSNQKADETRHKRIALLGTPRKSQAMQISVGEVGMDLSSDSNVIGVGVSKGKRAKTEDLRNQDTTSMDLSVIVALVQKTISVYRMQSAAHFALHIDVQPLVSGIPADHILFKSELRLTFQNYSRQIDQVCRFASRKGRLTSAIFAREKGRWIPLAAMLAVQFPVCEADTSNETLKEYWDHNGKAFHWVGLPTELKEHIIRFCLSEDNRYRDKCSYVIHGSGSIRQRGRKGLYELIDQIGAWRSLLHVSTQVRTIALRLCLSGGLGSNSGLCITSHCYFDFQWCLTHLDKYSQIMEPGSVPSATNPMDPGHMLQETYRSDPRSYPELHRYATFLHGLYKVDISFGFVDYYRFFEVTVGGFAMQKKRTVQKMTCGVSENLPFLRQIVVRLPEDRHQWRNHAHEPEILYERIAEALAAYPSVEVENFLDDSEQGRFLDLRQAARKALATADQSKPQKLTVRQLLELNDYDGRSGGIPLANAPAVGCEMEGEAAEDETTGREHFYPILCECAVPCREAFNM